MRFTGAILFFTVLHVPVLLMGIDNDLRVTHDVLKEAEDYIGTNMIRIMFPTWFPDDLIRRSQENRWQASVRFLHDLFVMFAGAGVCIIFAIRERLRKRVLGCAGERSQGDARPHER